MDDETQLPAHGGVRHVLLATDLRPASARAAEKAIEIARQHGAVLLVLSVIDRSTLPLPGGLTRRVDQERDRLEYGVRSIVERARDAGVVSTYLIWDGDPAESILDASTAESADVLVMGSRGRASVRRRLLGSVSSRVARGARCEVVIVPGG
jgi:nucleotide-binding universal stress UspA family protein